MEPKKREDPAPEDWGRLHKPGTVAGSRQRLGRGRGPILPENPRRERSPAGTLIPEFWPPDIERISIIPSHLVRGHLQQYSQRPNTKATDLEVTGTNLKIHLHLGDDKREWREICKRLKPYDRCVVIYSSLSSRSCYTNILKRTFKNTIHRPQLTNFFMISIAGVSSEMF